MYSKSGGLLIRAVFMLISLVVAVTLRGEDTLEVNSTTRTQERFFFNGYIKGMPSAGADNISDGVTFNSSLNNRLNFRYVTSDRFHVSLEVRNRLLAGEMIREYGPLMKEMLQNDNGLADASYVPLSGEGWLWHLNADRFYADWRGGRWQVRIGRQRINWGINMVSNPNDLFNNFSFFDFDYEERPGADAIRIQHFTGDMSRIELAVSPAKTPKEAVAAMLYSFNRKGYDFQFIAGYFRHRTALGAGWAGNLRSSGFKGEVTLFNNLDQTDSMTVVVAAGVDHMFDNSMYLFAEILYNGGYTGDITLFRITEPMRADNLFISKYAATISIMYPVSPVLATSLALVVMPDIEAFYVMPNITWSVVQNLDVALVLQYFRFQQMAGFRQTTGYLQAKWSF
jgi:hypothetical protein